MSKKNTHGIEYCLVAQKNRVDTSDSNTNDTQQPTQAFNPLGDYPSNKKGFGETVSMLLSRIPRQNHKRTLTQSLNHFHYKVSGEMCFFCVSKADYPMRICFAFLDDLETQFLRTRPNDPQKMKNLLKTRMAHFNNTENDKILQLHGQIDEVKTVMIDNIEKVLSRGESLEKLVDRTEELADSSVDFKRGTKKLKNRMWWRNVLLVALILFILIAIVFVAVWLGCGFPTFYRCRSKKQKKRSIAVDDTSSIVQFIVDALF